MEVCGVNEHGIKWMAVKLSTIYGEPVEDCFQEIVLGVLEASKRDIEGKYSASNRLFYAKKWASMKFRKAHGIDSKHTTPTVFSIEEDNNMNSQELRIDIPTTTDFDTGIIGQEVRSVMDLLTPRQRKICYLLADGYKRKDIKDMVGLSHVWLLHEIKAIRKVFEEHGITAK